MSKWNRPMRRYQSADLRCSKCGERVIGNKIGWTHMTRLGIKHPAWHLPDVAA